MESIEICPEGGEGVVIKNYRKKDDFKQPASNNNKVKKYYYTNYSFTLKIIK